MLPCTNVEHNENSCEYVDVPACENCRENARLEAEHEELAQHEHWLRKTKHESIVPPSY